MKALTISLVGFLLAIAATDISFCDGNSNVLCFESERQALLKFKQDLIDPSNRLSSWVEGGNCCKWTGVFCHNLTGHINELHLASSLPDIDAPLVEWEAYYRSKLGGKINPSLLDLKHLSFLDLSNNNFSSIPIPKFIGLLGSLACLNLSHSQFQGAIPHELGNLSRLHYLDVGGNYELKEAKNFQWVSGLSSLQHLDLSDVNLTKATDWLQVTNKLPFLLELHLSNCSLKDDPSMISVNSTNPLTVLDLSGNSLYLVPTWSWMFSLHGLVSIDLSYNLLEGPIPDDFRNISFLEVLDLSLNFLDSSIPNSLYSLNHLQFLNLGSNEFQGKISNFIGNFSSVIHLDLSYNMLEGRVSTSLEHLCNLKEIDLSYNEIDQELSEILHSLSSCGLDQLESLNMANTQLSGSIPFWIGELSSLKLFDVSENQLNGPIPFSVGKLSFLKLFDVSKNQLNGTFPQSFGQLANLETLSFGHNLLGGVVSEMHFSNLKRLRILKASGNLLRFKPNLSWIPPFHCESIKLGNWDLGPQFPQWLKSQKYLYELDISQARISDVIPTWFWNLSTHFEHLNLSHNQLIGGISYLPVGSTVDLSWNQLGGPLPQSLSPTLSFVCLSKNLFSGSLSQFVCNSSSERIWVLQFNTNLLSGEIPDCWRLWKNLWLLNLGNNNLTGKIPRSLGLYTNLGTLNLRNNSLFGELPSTLQNSTGLFLLDLSENLFSGSIPAWIGDKLSGLVVLSLRSNNFRSHIPNNICALNSLQNLDLGHNNISGAIPKCFDNLNAMATKNKIKNFVFMWEMLDNIFYLEESLVVKGREDEYSTTLGLVTRIDLSANSLTGDIPKELGNLMGLLSLNLSRNLLTRKIPENIGNMVMLESLDLSMNRLSGEIPLSLSNLSFLNHLNLSYNNLKGQIPSGTQLQSFDNFSYMGNHLCGPPVTKSCNKNGKTSDVTNGGSSEGRNRSKVNWLYVSIVLGFMTGFWGVVAPLYFIKSWRFAYYKKLEHIGDKLYVFWATIGM